MRKNLLFTFLLICFVSLFSIDTISAQKWTGAGDGKSWNDGANWEGGAVPGPKAQITFQKAATVSGTVPNIPAIIKVQKNITVTFDLDITIGDGVEDQHALTLAEGTTVNLGTDGKNRKFTINTTKNKQGIACFGANPNAVLNIAKTTTLTAKQTQFGINFANETGVVNNYGTIIIEDLVTTGIKSVGTVNNYGKIDGLKAGNNGIIMAGAGNFINHPAGDIEISAKLNDCIELQDGSSFTNQGKLTLTKAANSSKNQSALVIAGKTKTTKFVHDSEFPLNITGLSDSSIAVLVDTMGVFENKKIVNISGSEPDSSVVVLGKMNNFNDAILTLDKGSVTVGPTGNFTNDYIFELKQAGSKLVTNGTSVNNGFYNYAGGGAFSEGTGQITDNGLAFRDTVDAAGSCTIDLTNLSLEWFEGAASLGKSDGTGKLLLAPKSLHNNPALLTTTIQGVSILIKNYCPEAWNNTVITDYKWTGSGDGTSWNDGANWDSGTVPTAKALITIPKAATITGNVPNNPSIIKVQKDITVTFDLDLSIGDGIDEQHALTIAQNSTVNLGTDNSARIFNIFTPQNKQGIAAFGANNNVILNIAKGTTLNLHQTQFGINFANETSIVNNHGKIVIDSFVTTGIKTTGTFNNFGMIDGINAGNNGIIMVGPGHFKNNKEGEINISAKVNDCMELQDGSTFTNKGKLRLTKNAKASQNQSALVIAGKTKDTRFVHESEFPLFINGLSDSAVVVMVDTFGVFENKMIVNLAGNEPDSSFMIYGKFINSGSSVLNVEKGSIIVTTSGNFRNDYIIEMKNTASRLITNGASTNNAFYNYAGGGEFSTGTGQISDFGLAFVDSLDAGGSCTVDLTNLSLEWFEGVNSLGKSNDNGELTFAPKSLLNNPAFLSTTIPGVLVKIKNYCPEAWNKTSVGDFDNTFVVNVYPTLARNGYISVQIEGTATEYVSAKLVNSNGEYVKKISLMKNITNIIDVNGLNAGLYLLHIEGIPHISKKIIIGE